MSGPQPRGRAALVAPLALVAAATLIPDRQASWPHDFWSWRAGDAVEFVLNILLFVPLGLSLRRGIRRPAVSILVVLLVPAIVEALQYTLVVGRDGSIRDYVANVVGGLVAFAAAPHLRLLANPSSRAALRLACAAALLWMAHAAFSMLAFRPSFTPYQYFAQVAPHLGQFDVFPGTVSRAEVNGALVYDGPFPAGLGAETWEFEPIDLAASIAVGRPSSRLAPILSIADARANEIAFLGQQGADLVFRTRTRADAFGLRTPVVMLASAFSATPAALRVAGSRDGYVLTTSVATSAGGSRTASVSLTPALGWMLWWPFGVPTRAITVCMTALWLVLPIGAIAFWSGVVAKGSWRVALVPLVAAITGAHIAIPFAFGAASHGAWPKAIAIAVSALGGLALGASRKSGSRS